MFKSDRAAVCASKLNSPRGGLVSLDFGRGKGRVSANLLLTYHPLFIPTNCDDIAAYPHTRFILYHLHPDLFSLPRRPHTNLETGR
jgi:hypothetical protein